MFFDVTEEQIINESKIFHFSVDRERAYALFITKSINCYKLQHDGRFEGKYISYGSTNSVMDAQKWINGEEIWLMT